MKKTVIYIVIISFSILLGFRNSEASRDDYYKTYEVIQITENGLTLQDSDGNVIEVNKDPEGYKVGYKVRYDKIRNRLHADRWQDYKIVAISDAAITLEHKTGDRITVKGYFKGKYDIGDPVRYNSINNKVIENSK